jgi:hypothetical protein
MSLGTSAPLDPDAGRLGLRGYPEEKDKAALVQFVGLFSEHAMESVYARGSDFRTRREQVQGNRNPPSLSFSKASL